MPKLSLKPLAAADLETFRRLLGSGEFGGCFCAVWTCFGEDWERRCADPAQPNFHATSRAVAQGRQAGYFVHEGDELIGWTGSGPKTSFPLLKDKLGSRLSAFSERIWSVGCIALKEEYRGRKLSEGVVRAVIEEARAKGAEAVEAYPVRPFHEPRMYRGTLGLYRRLGFVEAGSDRDGEHDILLMRYPLS